MIEIDHRLVEHAAELDEHHDRQLAVIATALDAVLDVNSRIAKSQPLVVRRSAR